MFSAGSLSMATGWGPVLDEFYRFSTFKSFALTIVGQIRCTNSPKLSTDLSPGQLW